MHLENIVIDAAEPRALAAFWEAALGAERITDGPDLAESRISVPDGPVLDLCFPRVPDPSAGDLRLHLDLLGGIAQDDAVDRVRRLGARPLDIGQRDVPWVVMADVEGGAFCVMEERADYSATGPVAALPLHSADPDRDLAFWAWLTGWEHVPGAIEHTLRHPSRHGPLLELCAEPAPKGVAKNRIHLDVRCEEGEDEVAAAAGIAERGGGELHPGWGELPWRVFADPSGNEFCVLPAHPPDRG